MKKVEVLIISELHGKRCIIRVPEEMTMWSVSDILIDLQRDNRRKYNMIRKKLCGIKKNIQKINSTEVSILLSYKH